MASSVATPLERRFGRIAGLTEMTSTSTLGSTSITLQFDLDRNVDAAARDVQAAIAAAGGELPPDLPLKPTYRKVNPADAPILIISLNEPDPAAVAGLRRRQHHPRAEDLAGARRRAGHRRRRPAARRARPVRPVGLAGMGVNSADVRGASARRRSTRPRGRIVGNVQTSSIGANDQLLRRQRLQAARHRAERPGDRASSGDVAQRLRRRARTTASPGGPTASAPCSLIVRKQPDANIIETNERVKALLPELATSDLAGDRHGDQQRPDADDPRVGAGRREDARRSACVLVVVVVFAFLRSGRATLVPAVAMPLSLVGHVRRDVAARLQHRQPVADGADHLDGLRRGRRHRRDREHHARDRAGRTPVYRRRSRAPSRSASRSCRSPSRSSPCSCPSC